MPRTRRCRFCLARTPLPFSCYAEAGWHCLRAYGRRGKKVEELVACPRHGAEFDQAVRDFLDDLEDRKAGILPAARWGPLGSPPDV